MADTQDKPAKYILTFGRYKMKSTFKLSFILVFLINSFFLMMCDYDDLVSSDNSHNNVSNTNFTAEDSFFYKIDVINHSGLNLTGINGTIVVTEKSGVNSAIIKGVRQVDSESIRDAKDHLEQLIVDVQDMEDEILVRTLQPQNSEGRNYIVNYTITLPQNMDIMINSVNGHIMLNEIQGNVFVNLINGSIESEVTLPPGGNIDMKIINGNLALNIPRNTSAKIDANTINGSVCATNIEIQDCVDTLRSLSGTCGEGNGRILLNTINGIIMIAGFEKPE
jgi:DUF4097 and DUF4098 domain-containing protein YvlB